MKWFFGNLEEQTLWNDNFRKVHYTGKHMQLVLMSLEVGEDIGEEVHTDTDQFFRFESGNGKVVIDENEYAVTWGDGVIVPSGARHNIINTSTTETLKIYTIYAPSHHQDAVVRKTKAEAVASSPEFDGKTSE